MPEVQKLSDHLLEILKKASEGSVNMVRSQVNLTKPLLGNKKWGFGAARKQRYRILSEINTILHANGSYKFQILLDNVVDDELRNFLSGML